MGLLVLCWAQHLKAAVQAPVVPPVDPSGGGVHDVAEGAVGAGLEDDCSDAFGL